MNKNYFRILLAVLLLNTSGEVLKAQCTTPSPPSVSGTTLAGCTSSSAFTLTATGTSTNQIGWYANSFGGNALSTNSVFTTPTLTQGTVYYVGQSAPSSTGGGSGTGAGDTLAMPDYSINVPALETRGYYFTAPHDFIITGLRVPVVIGGTLSGIAVVKLPQAPPLYTSVTNTFNTLFLNQNIAGTSFVSVNIPVYTGDIIGVLGERGGYSAYGPNQGTGMYASMLGTGGSTVNLYRMGMLYNLATTAPQDLWTEQVNTIGMVEMVISKVCNSTLTPVTVSVVGVPQVTVTPPPHVCANAAYTLTAGGASTYTWTGGPQTSSYVVNPSSTTTYSVKGSILSTCQSTLTTVTITVDPSAPTVTASASSASICSGNTIALNGTGGPAATFSWSGGANSVSNNNPFTPLATQIYSLYGTNACGTTSTAITVTVHATPTLVTSSSPTAGVCEGHTTTLTVTGALTYSWVGASAPGANFVVTPAATTDYTVSGVSSAGCIASTVHNLNVFPAPVVTAVTNKQLVCSGGSATLTAGGANTYSWTNNSATTTTTVVNPLASTIYTVTGTYTSNGCSTENTVSVNVFDPVLLVSNSSTVCEGAALSLTANATAGSTSTYLWSNGSTYASNNIVVTAPAVYIVTVTTNAPGVSNCKSTATITIGMNAIPTISISATKTVICKGEKLLLTASGGTTYIWKNLTPTTNTVQVNPNVANTTTGYTVTGTDANGCSNSGTIAVKVNACTGIEALEKGEVFVSIYPNPNNGTFVIEVKQQTHLVLINQLGQSVKELNFDESNNYQQEVRDLSNGIYFIKGLTNGSSIQNKIIVNK